MTELEEGDEQPGSTSSGPWAVISASVRGAAHVRDGRPNQDAVRTESRPDEALDLIAVSDGHGGARYVRSDLGSRNAVDVAVELSATWWADTGRQLAPEQLASRCRADLFPAIVETWRRRCLDDLARRPFDDDERARSGVSDLDSEPTIAYGATLLLALLGAEAIVLIQLGDGDVIVAGSSGDAVRPVPTDDRLVGGQTTSLCLASAVDDFRMAVLRADEVGDLVVVASDGYGNSFADPSWPGLVLADLRAQISRRGDDAIATDLPGWLTESAEAAGDDVTVAVARRRQPPPAGGAPTARRAVVPPPPPPATERTRSRWPLAVVGVAVLAFVGGLLAGTVLDGDDGPDASAAPSDATTTTTAPTVMTTAPTILTTTTTTTLTPGPEAVAVAGPLGNVIEFDLDRAAPRPRRLRPITPTGLGLVLEVAMPTGDRWRIGDTGDLEHQTSGTATWVPLDLGGPRAATLHVGAGTLWVVDQDERVLVMIDPATAAVIGQTEITDESPPAGEGSGSGDSEQDLEPDS